MPNPPAARLLGRRVLEADPRAGTAKVRFRAVSDFLNRRGTIQGGILAAMFDSAFGSTLIGSLERGESIVTLEMKVSFIRPAAPGTIIGSARVISRGRTIAFLEGELRDEEGTLLATATSTFRIAGKRTTQEEG
jgi:uncharacterized protein (TIGR00369 family)